jgi:hypothetical protein
LNLYTVVTGIRRTYSSRADRRLARLPQAGVPEKERHSNVGDREGSAQESTPEHSAERKEISSKGGQ